jgi:hypothetical protein
VPGMNSGLNPADPTLVAAFRSALLHQGAIALIIIAFLFLLWVTARTWRYTTPVRKPDAAPRTAEPAVRGWRFGRSGNGSEPAGRRLLRIGFGLIWILDGVLQAQPKMAGGAEFKEAGVLLGSADKDVELVAVVANPTYRAVEFTQAFDREEGLNTVPNWLYLTGSLGQLGQVWRQYGITVENLPAGSMSAHNDLAVVIDRSGHIRDEVGADPGPGTASTKSSFSVLLSQYARQALAGA